eukprot:4653040-Pyramimonas_sp.AAC.1
MDIGALMYRGIGPSRNRGVTDSARWCHAGSGGRASARVRRCFTLGRVSAQQGPKRAPNPVPERGP